MCNCIKRPLLSGQYPVHHGVREAGQYPDAAAGRGAGGGGHHRGEAEQLRGDASERQGADGPDLTEQPPHPDQQHKQRQAAGRDPVLSGEEHLTSLIRAHS